jgi:hypothetical protein
MWIIPTLATTKNWPKKHTDDYQEGKASVKTKTDGNGSIDDSKQAEYTAAYVVDTLDHKA